VKTKLAIVFCLGLLALLGLTAPAHAQGAPAPVGHWRGAFDDGSGFFELSLTSDGSAYVNVSNVSVVTGRWEWNPTATGGIVTVHYYNAGFPSKLYYGVTWIDRGTVRLSDPWFAVTLRRLG
jgi:hypothetical protein